MADLEKDAHKEEQKSRGLLDAVAGGVELNSDLKEKMNSPSHKKPAVPKPKKKKEPKILNEEEFQGKMGEIEQLEGRLQQAKAEGKSHQGSEGGAAPSGTMKAPSEAE